MMRYSPYDNIAAQSYPAMLVRTSYNDSQVMYWEPAKYVAKLRATKTDSNPLLLKTTWIPRVTAGIGTVQSRARSRVGLCVCASTTRFALNEPASSEPSEGRCPSLSTPRRLVVAYPVGTGSRSELLFGCGAALRR